MATNQYQFIPVPGYTQGDAYNDPELLYSTAAFTQKGVTLGGGGGVYAAGTLLAQRTSDKKYYRFDPAGGIPGLERARGILRRPVNTGGPGAPDQLSNMVIQGIVKLNMVIGAHSAPFPVLSPAVLAGAYEDIGGYDDDVRGTLKF